MIDLIINFHYPKLDKLREDIDNATVANPRCVDRAYFTWASIWWTSIKGGKHCIHRKYHTRNGTSKMDSVIEEKKYIPIHWKLVAHAGIHYKRKTGFNLD